MASTCFLRQLLWHIVRYNFLTTILLISVAAVATFRRSTSTAWCSVVVGIAISPIDAIALLHFYRRPYDVTLYLELQNCDFDSRTELKVETSFLK